MDFVLNFAMCSADFTCVNGSTIQIAFSEYALLTYGNMPVHPRFGVKRLLKCKSDDVFVFEFQKKFHSKMRLDGHITIREKSVLLLKINFLDLNKIFKKQLLCLFFFTHKISS